MNDIQIRKGKKKKNQIKGEKMTTRVVNVRKLTTEKLDLYQRNAHNRIKQSKIGKWKMEKNKKNGQTTIDGNLTANLEVEIHR